MALLGLMAGRAAFAWGAEMAALKMAILIKDRLRRLLLQRLTDLGPMALRKEQTGELTNVLTEGVEALDGYYSQYLPQLVLAAAVPTMILVVVFPQDILSGLVLLLTGPLIPFFMWLIGSAAAQLTRRQWTALSQMSAYFLDVIQGLTTLKMLGRSQEQTEKIARLSDRFREVTLRVLRMTFLSALALEWLSTLSTALIAVQIGLRLLHGQVGFATAFFVLVLAPEYYAPLRNLGLRFHAAAAGRAAAERIFALLDAPIQGAVALGQSRAGDGCFGKPLSGDIVFERVSFGYGADRGALKDISLRLPEGKITALVGPSGAGKSTLAGLLLGFGLPQKGIIRIGETVLSEATAPFWRSQVAWVPQDPYLFDGTVLENLRLANPAASLQEVENAARLAGADDFIDALPHRYHTRIGERGLRLSAGQAQRLALARAFLRRASLVILDEPTAHLDSLSEWKIAEAIARLAQDRTVLVIAHRLNTVRHADQVIVLREGRVVQAGSPSTLRRQPGPYRDMLQATEKAWRAKGSTPALVDPPRALAHASAALQSASEKNQSPTGFASLPKVSPFSFLFRLMQPFVRQIALSVGLGFGAIASGVGLMGCAAYILARAALQPSIADLQVAIVGVRFFGLGRGVLRYLERLSSHQAAFLLLARLRTTFYQKLEPLAPIQWLGRHSGDLLRRIISDINRLEAFYVRGIGPFLMAGLVIPAMAFLMKAFSGWFALILCGLLVTVGGGLPLLAYRLGKSNERSLVRWGARLNTALVDFLQGMPDLLVFDQTAKMARQVHRFASGWSLLQWRNGLANAGLNALTAALAHFCSWLILWTAVQMTSSGRMDGVWIGALVLMAFASFEAVQPLSLAAQHLSADGESARRLLEVIQAPPLILPASPPQPLPEDFTLRVEQLSFAYPPAPGENVLAPFQLRDIQLDLLPGKRLAIVGPSGAGKSTLVNLLLRLLDYQSGRITLGGVDLHRLDPQELRRRIAVLPQTVYLFAASVRDNLRLARPEASEAEMLAACRQAQILEVIQSLPQGLDTCLGEGGAGLSAGEKQRLGLARALLKDSPLLILDEPAAHLDALTERALSHVLTQPRPGQALLAITHHLSSLTDFDEILVLDQGCIVERGSYAQLMERGGLFRQMVLTASMDAAWDRS